MENKVSDNTLVFTFSERLDTLAAMSLQKEILDTIAAHDSSLSVKFDFAGVEYIASGFIRILLLVVRIKDKRFSIVNVGSGVREILEMGELDRLITMS